MYQYRQLWLVANFIIQHVLCDHTTTKPVTGEIMTISFRLVHIYNIDTKWFEGIEVR